MLSIESFGVGKPEWLLTSHDLSSSCSDKVSHSAPRVHRLPNSPVCPAWRENNELESTKKGEKCLNISY